ncbi:ATPase/DNA packaging protein [Sulfurimonas indica]|uniref:ATPase/DNA packaging protein n=1 Tax=Sulfurimonas TaxID=202746 RepID=UPI001264F67B|nr:ATPase/DNA packaging protein [Sulfurimonas indica]
MSFIYGRLANRPDVPPIEWNPDSSKSINPHMLCCGGSGSGKTTFLLKIAKYLTEQKKHIYIFDLKGDMVIKNDNGEIIGNYIEFTAWNSKYGINPFEFDTGVSAEELASIINGEAEADKEQLFKMQNSGPKVQIQRMIEIIKKNFMPNMGTNQKDVLYDLLMDTYLLKGFVYNDIKTWGNTLPDLSDTLMLIEKIIMFFNGEFSTETDSVVEDFTDKIFAKIKNAKLNKTPVSEIQEEINKLLIDFMEQSHNDDEISDLNPKEWFCANNIEVNKYMKKDVIRTVEKLASYINALVSSEIFNSKTPPVKPGLNVINISGLDVEIQRFIVDVWLGKVFKACKIRGTYSERKNKARGAKVDTYVLIDESKLIAGTSRDKNDPYSYLNRIATEARGFGFGIIVAAQSAEHFPPEFLKNFDAQIILNTGIADFDSVRRSFGVSKELLEFTQYGWGKALVKTGKMFSKVNFIETKGSENA